MLNFTIERPNLSAFDPILLGAVILTMIAVMAVGTYGITRSKTDTYLVAIAGIVVGVTWWLLVMPLIPLAVGN